MNTKKNHHYILLFILSLNYIFPLLIFGKITLFYVDALDSEIVYNHILGKYYGGEANAVKDFLGGSIKIDYLRRLYQPFSLFYLLFNTELAYWLIDIFVKITSYFSFYLLAKKINKNLFFCSLGAAVYASINLPTHEGFYLAIFPYATYLIFFKRHISLKHYFIIFFFGLNSDILRSPFFIPIILVLSLLIRNEYNNFVKNLLKVSIVFLSAILISNINIIITVLSEITLHREEWVDESFSLIETIKNFFNELVSKGTFSTNYHIGLGIPLYIFKISVLLFSLLFLDNKKILKTLLIIIIIYLIISFLKFDLIVNFLEITKLKIYNFEYLSHYIIVFLTILYLFIVKEKFKLKNYFLTFVFFSLFLMQINSSIGPIYKKYFYNDNKSFQNYYTFQGYYQPDEYKKIKKIVNEDRVFSIGLDPMIPVINNIKVIDGYHNLYPLSYKKKFFKVIEEELNQNEKWKKYYNNWGSRLYVIVKNPKNLKIDFKQSKKLGAKFVISKYLLSETELAPVCENCENNGFYIYKIK